MSAQISQGLCFGKEKIDQVVAIQPQGPTTWGSQPSTWGGGRNSAPNGRVNRIKHQATQDLIS